MTKAIVIGCKTSGLGLVRALANQGIHLIALTYSDGDFAHLSKNVSEVVRICPPEDDNDKFINFLVENASRWEGALILETSDAIAVPLAKNKELLSKYYKVATPDWDILKIFIEKELTYSLARECNIPHPQYHNLKSLVDLDELDNIKFPCILKPVSSSEFVSKFQVKNFLVENELELREKFSLCLDSNLKMILQEIIPGPDDCLYRFDGYINTKGDLVGRFFNRKLRQSPPQFGVMRVGISTGRNPDVEELTRRLLNKVNYRGYFSTEFKQDSRDGQLKLIENNCRLVRCSLLATASGVNLPLIMYLDLVKNQQIDIKHYHEGMYWIELYADLSDSLSRHQDENLSLRDYVGPYFARDKVFADLALNDLNPFMHLSSQKFRNFAQRYLKLVVCHG